MREIGRQREGPTGPQRTRIRLAHHHLLLAGLPAHLCENAQEPTRWRIIFSIPLFPIELSTPGLGRFQVVRKFHSSVRYLTLRRN